MSSRRRALAAQGHCPGGSLLTDVFDHGGAGTSLPPLAYAEPWHQIFVGRSVSFQNSGHTHPQRDLNPCYRLERAAS